MLDPEQQAQAADFIVFFVVSIAIALGALFALWRKIDEWRGINYDMSSYDEGDEGTENEEIQPVAQPSKIALRPIAKPQNDRMVSLRFAENAKIEALAQLILESRHIAFKNGIVPETRSIKALFGISPSPADDSDYKRIKRLLAIRIAELQKPEEPPQYRPLDEKCQPAEYSKAQASVVEE